MDKKKSQSYNFCYDIIPALFHSQTDEFMKYIERDGLKFLQFWWDHVGEKLPFEQLVPFGSVKFETVERGEKRRIVFISLPPPPHEYDIYFLALIRDPEKHFAWLRLPSTRIVCLVRRSKDDFKNGTQLGDLTPRAIYQPIGSGPQPTLEQFKEAVFDLTKPRTPTK
jgi:hypothetical protein